MYVPPAFTRQDVPVLLDPQTRQKLSEAEIVLGVVVTDLTDACRLELSLAMELHKNMIVMSYPPFAPQLLPYFRDNLVEIDPANPGEAEVGIVQYLKDIQAQESAKKALLALGTLALGLLILAPAARD